MKYCPNCNIEGDDGFCPDCGIPLIEKPVANDIPGINLGDGNAISGGLNVNASKSIHNEDRSVHNIQNTTSTVNNIQNVAVQKNPMELLQERKTLYLNACERAYEDTKLDDAEKFELDRYRMELGLDEATANKIWNEVKQLGDSRAKKSELEGIAKIRFNKLTDALKKNDIAGLMGQIDNIEVLVGKFSNDELHRKYYLVLAALKEDNCIEKYTSSIVDNYWQSFWSCLAYQKKGQTARAEEILFSLTDKFPNHPEDNMSLLAVACAYMRKDMAEAAELLQAVSGDYTPGLQRFAESLYLLMEPETAKEMGATEQGCAFYLVNFFGRNLAAEEEARRKAAEEEANRQAEEYAKRKAAEEDAKRKAAEEEAKRQAEEDAKRKAAEEEAKRQADEGYMLVIDGQQAGPFGKEQLQELVQKDVLTGQTYVWKQGMANWEFAENVPEVKALLKQQPDKSAYMLVLNGQQAGPYDMNQLQQLARDGVLTGDTYAWKQGMANWEFAENVRELQSILMPASVTAVSVNCNEDSYNVILESRGNSTLQVVKTVKESLQLDLREAKEIVDNTPCVITTDVPKSKAENLKKTLEKVGAKVKIEPLSVISKIKKVGKDNDSLAALCEDIVGSTYIETLHLNRSWVLPQFIDMGYDYGRVKAFSSDEYNYWISRLELEKCWKILVRNLKALAAMKDKSSYAYKIRSGWWTKEVAIAMAESDLKGFKKYIGGLKAYTNSCAGAYVKIPYMRGVDREFRENYFYIDTPKKEPRSGWDLLYNVESRTLPNLYEEIEIRINLIRKAKNDQELYEAVKQYNDERYTSDLHFRKNWNDKVKWADEFVNAYIGDGTYSAMMTMVKYLGLRYKDDSGNELDHNECIQGIVNKVLDSGFDGAELLDFCKEKFFDSGVFKYKEYKK